MTAHLGGSAKKKLSLGFVGLSPRLLLHQLSKPVLEVLFVVVAF